MRFIGFSTGALACGDFGLALKMLSAFETKAVELSALRDHEIDPLMSALPSLDLHRYSYVSVHAPSAFRILREDEVATRLWPCIDWNMPVIIHPDVIQNPAHWKRFGPLLCIENMDKRKRTGRTADELEYFFSELPEATFCLDLGHGRQIDSTMSETRRTLRKFGQRLRQIHFSEIDTQGQHHAVTLATILACRNIIDLIAHDVPVIIESQIPSSEIAKELEVTAQTFTCPERERPAFDSRALA